MVALDHSPVLVSHRLPRLPLPAVLASAALVLFAVGFALGGFGDNGLRLGTQLVWRLGCLVFFALLAAAPLGNRIPALHALAGKSRMLLHGFCAVLAVYFAVILLPNLFAVPDGVRPTGITAGMTFFVLFTGAVMLTMAAAVHRGLQRRIGAQACRALLGVAMTYFWLCYTLIGVAHLSHPGRPDPFYEFSVILMAAGLLARMTDRLARLRRRPPSP